MKIRVLSVLAAASLAVSTPALAHHSGAQYDLTKRDMSWTGVLKEFRAVNPHAHIVVEVKDAKGTHDIAFEGQSMSNMYRRGWRPGMLKIGDTITINAAPRKDGADGGFVLSILAADGQKF